jgi:hypothetical protein
MSKGGRMSAETDKGNKPKQKGNAFLPMVEIIDQVKEQTVVALEITRNGNFTIATAHFSVPGRTTLKRHFVAQGASVKNETDKENVSIGDSLAISRALRKLASTISAVTMEDVHQRCQSQNPFRHMSNNDLENYMNALYLERECRELEEDQKAVEKEKYLSLRNGVKKNRKVKAVASEVTIDEFEYSKEGK